MLEQLVRAATRLHSTPLTTRGRIVVIVAHSMRHNNTHASRRLLGATHSPALLHEDHPSRRRRTNNLPRKLGWNSTLGIEMEHTAYIYANM